VFAANAFAILGLRALYFCLAGMRSRFRHLDRGLAVILGFVGVKMLLVEVVHLPTAASLGVIAAVIAIAILASVRADRRDPPDRGAVDPLEPTRRLSHGTLHHQ